MPKLAATAHPIVVRAVPNPGRHSAVAPSSADYECAASVGKRSVFAVSLQEGREGEAPVLVIESHDGRRKPAEDRLFYACLVLGSVLGLLTIRCPDLAWALVVTAPVSILVGVAPWAEQEKSWLDKCVDRMSDWWWFWACVHGFSIVTVVQFIINNQMS